MNKKVNFYFAALLGTMSPLCAVPALASQSLIATAPDFDYASPILVFSIFRGQNRHFCPRLVSFEYQTRV